MLRNINIRSRLLMAFSVIIFLLLCLGGIAISSMKSIRVNAETIEVDVLPAITSLGDVNSNLMRVRIFTLRLLNDSTEGAKRATLVDLERIKKNVAESRAEYERAVDSVNEKRLFEQFAKQESHYYKLQDQVVALAMKGEPLAIEALVPEMNDAADDMVRLLRALVTLNQEGAEQATMDSANKASF
jgi:methyl-accepting chemotaxis protein